MSWHVLDDENVVGWTVKDATFHARTRERGQRVTAARLHEEWLAIHKGMQMKIAALEAERLRLDGRTAELGRQASEWQQVVDRVRRVFGVPMMADESVADVVHGWLDRRQRKGK